MEDALKAALSLRESLLNEAADVDHPLLVRMGINLGPVRLVKDINGQPNIVGDGINVAQRVMSFADPSQILASRSYFDAASRLSPRHAGMFHYQGSRTDKHVREHEVYAIGYPGDKTTQRGKPKPGEGGLQLSPAAKLLANAKTLWNSAATRLDVWVEQLTARFQQAGPQLRAVYVGTAAIAALLLIVLTVKLIHRPAADVVQDNIAKLSANADQPDAAIEPKTLKPEAMVNQVNPDDMNTHAPEAKAEIRPKARPQATHPKRQKNSQKRNPGKNSSEVSGNGKAYLVVRCKAGTEVFVDGAHKGKIGSVPLRIEALPGSHTVIVSHPNAGVFSKNIEMESGKTMGLNPDFCNK